MLCDSISANNTSQCVHFYRTTSLPVGVAVWIGSPWFVPVTIPVFWLHADARTKAKALAFDRYI